MNTKQKNSQTSFVDYIFWFVFIIYSNPGGMLKALGENSGDGGINITDLLYVILLVCFIWVFRKDKVNNDKSYLRIVKYLAIFLIYYLLVFSFIVPILRDYTHYSAITTFIKIRFSVMHISLVVFVYEFYVRSYPIFFKYLLYSSIIIIPLFFISVLTGLDILPIKILERRFITTQRLIMESYGLMPLLIPMGAVVVVFRFDIKYRKAIFIGFVFMFMSRVLGIFRRYILGAFIYMFIAIIFNNFLERKITATFKKVFTIAFYLVILGFIIQLSFPKYIDAGIEAGKETIYVIKYGETSLGKSDSRLGLGKEFMQNLIIENFVFGTGFDNRWRTLVGNKAGYEASDYPFLGSIAMYGVFGLLFFLPVYIVLIKALSFDIKYLRKHHFDRHSFESFVLILFIIYFIYDLLQYINWFLPLSIIMDIKWYVFLAMYLASRKIFYRNEWLKKNNKVKLQQKLI